MICANTEKAGADMASLAQYLVRLGTDPDLKKRHAADPEGTMTKEGLDPKHVKAMKDKDATAIGNHLAEEFKGGAAALGMTMTTCVRMT
jgi:hypothetical protein